VFPSWWLPSPLKSGAAADFDHRWIPNLSPTPPRSSQFHGAKSLKADADAFLGHEVEEAITTVPAYFSDAQRKATRVAGELAGLKVERLLHEPTAAALAYGLQERGADHTFLVFDLGGGTFDVSLLELFDDVMEVRASAGDNFLDGTATAITAKTARRSRQSRWVRRTANEALRRSAPAEEAVHVRRCPEQLLVVPFVAAEIGADDVIHVEGEVRDWGNVETPLNLSLQLRSIDHGDGRLGEILLNEIQ